MNNNNNNDTELDGCKILKKINWITFTQNNKKSIEEIFHRISEQKVNLLFVSYIEKEGCHVSIGINPESESTVIEEIEAYYPCPISKKEAVMLSVFPHRNNPQLVGNLLSIFQHSNPEEMGFVNSFSAVSVVCSKKILKQSIKFFLDHFKFKRSITDWTRVYREKEHLCKEVIASYQEKRPKVYFLEYRDYQRLINIKINSDELLKYTNQLLSNFAKDIYVTFLASIPKKNDPLLALSFYPHENKMIDKMQYMDISHNMVVFSMNGPHFGDRYGIVSLLFKAINDAHVDLVGLNCSTHSIVGVIPRDHLKQTIDSLSSYFEIPSVINRT